MAMIQLWVSPPPEYLTRIGNFIVLMSYVETYIKQLLWKASSIGHEIGQLMTGGAQLDQICWVLKKIYGKYCDNQLVIDDIETITKELSDLKTIRDNMAHRQWHSDHKGVILSHKALAKTAEAVEETPYTVPELDAYCIRAYVLTGMILRHLVAREAAEFIEQHYRRQCDLPPAPWLYKSSPRVKKKGRRSGRTSPKRPRQQQSSQA